jgi:CubicO group peptidase (beta-lactamase class C family)
MNLSPARNRCAGLLTLAALALSISLALAAPLPTAKPEAVGMKAAPLAGISRAMQEQIAANHAAGVVTLVLRDGRVVHHEAAGYADREKRRRMEKDSVFWIASMTKSVSATAVMILVDEGKLSLDAPASQWLPELKKVKLASGPPKREITLRDLLSHTAGLQFPPRKATDGAISLRGYALELLKPPLTFEPGSAYEYNFGITIAGRIVEIVSGQSFEEFVAARLLRPLGMKDTTFHPDDRLRRRLALTYTTDEASGALARAYNPFVMPDAATRRMVEPSGGLFSTAADMARFYLMILNGGELDGRRIVSRAAVAEMTKAHTAGGKELNYGLGWQTGNAQRKAAPAFSAQAFGHGGAFGTHGLVDPENKLVVVFMVQNVLVKDGGKVREAFHQQVAEALKP